MQREFSMAGAARVGNMPIQARIICDLLRKQNDQTTGQAYET
jgi:hypothetical protein